ncbi:hypothetical protein MCHK_2997 [Mesorhizobium huakuii 7653R]|nr:hypothetical protein MCHK_2997 [Mesorhizobium huakuii 7653R]
MDLPGNNLLDSVKLPFKTEEERAALVGRKVVYLTREDIQDMGGKPHLFPQAGVVTAADRSAIQVDNGPWLNAEDIKLITAA